MDDLQKEYMSVPYVNADKTERKKFYLDKREEYIEMYDTWEKEDNKVERAAVLYFLMKTGFNGIWQSSKKADGKFYTPAGLLNHKEVVYNKVNVMLWSKLLNDTDAELTSKDWSDVTMGDFTFYDPPYRDSFTSYNTVFSDEQHKKLIARVEETREQGKYVWLCNRDAGDGFFDNLKSTIKRFPITYTAGRRKVNLIKHKFQKKGPVLVLHESYGAKQATEILLFNHETPPTSTLFKLLPCVTQKLVLQLDKN
jgi:DNA adenine methylase